MKNFMRDNWGLLAAIAMLFAFLFAAAFISVKQYEQQTQNDIVLVNPPQEVLDGRVQNMVTTLVYTSKNNTEVPSLVVNLCSGKTWEVPSNQINPVTKWLKSNLPPNKGCD